MKIDIQMLKDEAGNDLGFDPVRATDGAAGWDLRAAHDGRVYVNSSTTFRCGFLIEVEEGFLADVRSRSGLACKHSIFVINTPGTIDSDFRGELKVTLFNLGTQPFAVQRGDRIAQLVPLISPPTVFRRVEALSKTVRGAGGHGSTGVT